MGQLLVNFRGNTVIHKGINVPNQLVKNVDDLLKTNKKVSSKDFNNIYKLLPQWKTIESDKKIDTI